MRLTSEQIENLRSEIRRSTGKPCKITEAGKVEINNIPDGEKNRFINKLNQLDFIKSVTAEKSNYDFGNFDFINGKAQPKQIYKIVGEINENKVEEQIDESTDIDEAYTDAKCQEWIAATRNENVARMSDVTKLAYANGLFNFANDANRRGDRVTMRRCLTCLDQLNNSRIELNIKTRIQRYIDSINSDLGIRVNHSHLRFGEDINEEVEIHDELNPKLWNSDKTLKPEVKDKVLEIVDAFKTALEDQNIDLKIEDIYLVGSNANYNYNEDSDLDIHIIADESFDCSSKHLPIIYQCMKTLFNSKYDITIYGINAEVYVENKETFDSASTGIYSLNKGWITDPQEYKIPEIDNAKLDELVTNWSNKYQQILTNPTAELVDEYIDDLYDERIQSLARDGEFGLGNLLFKEIRRKGILDDLKQLKTELESKELSLEELEEPFEKLEDLTEKLEESLYEYEGPIFNNDEEIGYYKDLVIAKSIEEALQTIKDRVNKKENITESFVEPQCLSEIQIQDLDEFWVPYNNYTPSKKGKLTACIPVENLRRGVVITGNKEQKMIIHELQSTDGSTATFGRPFVIYKVDPFIQKKYAPGDKITTIHAFEITHNGSELPPIAPWLKADGKQLNLYSSERWNPDGGAKYYMIPISSTDTGLASASLADFRNATLKYYDQYDIDIIQGSSSDSENDAAEKNKIYNPRIPVSYRSDKSKVPLLSGGTLARLDLCLKYYKPFISTSSGEDKEAYFWGCRQNSNGDWIFDESSTETHKVKLVNSTSPNKFTQLWGQEQVRFKNHSSSGDIYATNNQHQLLHHSGTNNYLVYFKEDYQKPAQICSLVQNGNQYIAHFSEASWAQGYPISEINGNGDYKAIIYWGQYKNKNETTNSAESIVVRSKTYKDNVLSAKWNNGTWIDLTANSNKTWNTTQELINYTKQTYQISL